MTLLVSLIKTEEEFMNIHNRLKVSGEEKCNGLFVLAHREDKDGSDPVKPYKDLILMGKEKNTKQYVMEVLKYRGDQLLLNQLRDWQPPQFPVSGKDLIALGIPKGRHFGNILDRLKESWIESDYELTKEQLLENVPTVQAMLGKK